MDVITFALCKNLISKGFSEIGEVFKIKGSVNTFSNLPSKNNKSGDLYLVGPKEDGSYDEYYWIDSGKWELMGSTLIGMDKYINEETLFKGKDGTGTIENPADGTILKIVNSNVLLKNNIEEYIPESDYNPATKKYVDIAKKDAISKIQKTIISETEPTNLSNGDIWMILEK